VRFASVGPELQPVSADVLSAITVFASRVFFLIIARNTVHDNRFFQKLLPERTATSFFDRPNGISGRASTPCAPRTSGDARNATVFITSGGAHGVLALPLRTERDLGNTRRTMSQPA
jgi:hypothetical protein